MIKNSQLSLTLLSKYNHKHTENEQNLQKYNSNDQQWIGLQYKSDHFQGAVGVGESEEGGSVWFGVMPSVSRYVLPDVKMINRYALTTQERTNPWRHEVLISNLLDRTKHC